MSKIAKAAPAVRPPLALLAAHPAWCIFPLVRGGKEPAQGFTDNLVRASNDPQQIKAWSKQYPNANWGVSLAKSRLIVIDVDVKPGKVGRASLDMLELEHGPLPPTFEVETTTGGRHIYLQQTADVQHVQRQNAFGQDLDSPGYVVAPGSRLATGIYRIKCNLPVAAAPPWLAEYLVPSTIGDNAADQAPAVEQDTPAIIKRADYYLKHDAPPAIQGQNGEHTLLMVAATLKDMGISEPTAVERLAEIYNQRCEPPWQVGEGATADRLDVKVHNAWAYLKQTQPGALTPEAEFGDKIESADIETMVAVYKANPGYSKEQAKALRETVLIDGKRVRVVKEYRS
jgi:hypothetical protein